MTPEIRLGRRRHGRATHGLSAHLTPRVQPDSAVIPEPGVARPAFPTSAILIMYTECTRYAGLCVDRHRSWAAQGAACQNNAQADVRLAQLLQWSSDMKKSILAMVCLVSFLFTRNARSARRPANGDYVVMLHGMGRTRRSMQRIAGELSRKGYQPIGFGYSSLRHPVENHVKRLGRTVRTECTDESKRVHFVTHSLGGLVVRAYLKENEEVNVGRVVMLAPPNQGSKLADIAKRLRFSQLFSQRVGLQLGTDAGDLPKKLGPVGFELGVIAGDRTLNPLYSSVEAGRDDGKVAVANTKVAGMQDFLVVHSTHTFMIQRRYVIDQVVHFLNTGEFQRGH